MARVMSGSTGPQLVGDEQDRGAGGGQRAQGVGQRQLVGGIDTGGGLVEHQQVRLRGEGAGDEDGAAGRPTAWRHRGAGAVGQADRLDGLVTAAIRRPERLERTHPGEPART